MIARSGKSMRTELASLGRHFESWHEAFVCSSSQRARDPHGFHVPVRVAGTGTYGYGYGSGSGDPWTNQKKTALHTGHKSAITKNCTVAEFHPQDNTNGKKEPVLR
jgi:hypothetical protein